MNPFLIEEPAYISFSGGRTSGMLLHHILQAHGGELPDHVKVIFANTGKEMPQTLAFVNRVAREWSVHITWVECFARRGIESEGENMYVYETREVTFENASRKGEPFESLIIARSYLPNPVARFCTQELKVLRMEDYMRAHCESDSWVPVIGFRADEQGRVSKMRARDRDALFPLHAAGIVKQDVGRFWREQSFDLELANNNGVTPMGNCDLCFLKGLKRMSIIRENPGLQDWWIEQERRTGATFRIDQPSYSDMSAMATSNMAFDFDGEIEDCFCGEAS